MGTCGGKGCGKWAKDPHTQEHTGKEETSAATPAQPRTQRPRKARENNQSKSSIMLQHFRSSLKGTAARNHKRRTTDGGPQIPERTRSLL